MSSFCSSKCTLIYCNANIQIFVLENERSRFLYHIYFIIVLLIIILSLNMTVFDFSISSWRCNNVKVDKHEDKKSALLPSDEHIWVFLTQERAKETFFMCLNIFLFTLFIYFLCKRCEAEEDGWMQDRRKDQTRPEIWYFSAFHTHRPAVLFFTVQLQRASDWWTVASWTRTGFYRYI